VHCNACRLDVWSRFVGLHDCRSIGGYGTFPHAANSYSCTAQRMSYNPHYFFFGEQHSEGWGPRESTPFSMGYTSTLVCINGGVGLGHVLDACTLQSRPIS
jgi:hypothetical protein